MLFFEGFLSLAFWLKIKILEICAKLIEFKFGRQLNMVIILIVKGILFLFISIIPPPSRPPLLRNPSKFARF